MGNAEKLVAEYIQALELTGVYVVGPESARPVRIGAGRNVNKRVAEIAKAHWQPVQLHGVFWFDGERAADAVREECRRRLASARIKGEWFDVDGAAALELIHTTAGELGVSLEVDGDVRAHAEAAVTKVEAELERLRQTGGLKEINGEYKRYRQERAATGQAAVAYPFWFAQRKRQMVRNVARAVVGEGRIIR